MSNILDRGEMIGESPFKRPKKTNWGESRPKWTLTKNLLIQEQCKKIKSYKWAILRTNLFFLIRNKQFIDMTFLSTTMRNDSKNEKDE